MKVKKNNTIPSFEQLLNYLRKKSGKEEQNKLEKQMQKDPFLADAMEGIELSDMQRAQEDIERINSAILKKSNRLAQPKAVFRIAATIALLIVAISGWYITNKVIKRGSVRQLTVEQTQPDTTLHSPMAKSPSPTQLQEETITTEYQNDQLGSRNIAPIASEIAKPGSPNLSQAEIKQESVEINDELNLLDEDYAGEQAGEPPMPIRAVEAELDFRLEPIYETTEPNRPSVAEEIIPSSGITLPDDDKYLHGTILDANDFQPLMGATIRIEGTTMGTIANENGDFSIELGGDEDAMLSVMFIGMKTETFQSNGLNHMVILMENDITTLSEVAVRSGRSGPVGTSRNQRSLDEITAPQSQSEGAPQPVTGYRQYQQYIDSQAFLPSNYPAQKALVILAFEIAPSGRPYRFDVIRSPADNIAQRAIDIVKNGPNWEPSTAGNNKVFLAIPFKR